MFYKSKECMMIEFDLSNFDNNALFPLCRCCSIRKCAERNFK